MGKSPSLSDLADALAVDEVLLGDVTRVRDKTSDEVISAIVDKGFRFLGYYTRHRLTLEDHKFYVSVDETNILAGKAPSLQHKNIDLVKPEAYKDSDSRTHNSFYR
jgi:hypothetical protein